MKNCIFFILIILSSCQDINEQKQVEYPNQKKIESPSLIILGTVQDGGSPHTGCTKKCCESLWNNPDYTRKVVSLGLIDTKAEKTFIFEATPDIPTQLQVLNNVLPFPHPIAPDGIFLTHAHIGHYTGLMYLGREVMNASNVPLFAMPKMQEFLTNNGPWDQLIKLNNINLKKLKSDSTFNITSSIKVTPIIVPHRDEYSETVGYKIYGPNKSALFIPDIDKWHKWDRNIIAEIKRVNIALLDATFFANNEVKGRDMSEIPHPFIKESMDLFKSLPLEEKKKIYFIHFNHSNPCLDLNSSEFKEVVDSGFNIAQFKDVISL